MNDDECIIKILDDFMADKAENDPGPVRTSPAPKNLPTGVRIFNFLCITYLVYFF